FYLPTYGVLVASGVLIGIWISVRNSEKQGINGDGAWNFGILVVLAGIIGAFLMAAWYIQRHRMPALRTTDAFAPGLAFGHVLGRFGCFSAGCCYGKPTNHFWGVIFTNPLANAVSGTPLGVRIEPTQLIEAAAEFFNFLLLML